VIRGVRVALGLIAALLSGPIPAKSIRRFAMPGARRGI
jgi:hypothetical protein